MISLCTTVWNKEELGYAGNAYREINQYHAKYEGHKMPHTDPTYIINGQLRKARD